MSDPGSPDAALLEAFRQAAVASAPLAVTASDEHGRVVLWNPAAEGLFGYSREEALGRSLLDLGVVPEQEQQRFTELREKALSGEEIGGYVEGERQHRDGTRFQARVWPAPLIDEDGRLRGFLGYIVDVTEEKEQQARQLADERRFRAIFASSHDAIIIFDPFADQVLEANPSACDVLGYPYDELVELAPSQIHAHEVPEFRAFVSRLRRDGVARTDALSCQARDGELVPCEIAASWVTVGGREWVLASIRDVRERRRMEAELRGAEQRYRDLYERAPFAYFSVDADGRIRLANERARELLGYDELLGRSVLELYHPDSPDGLPRAHEVLSRYQAGEEIRGEELEMVAADGRSIWASLSVTPVTDEHGYIVASRSIVEDITARKLAEQRLEQTLDDLEQANAEISQIAFGVAHDLSAPLRTVSTYSQMLHRDLRDQLDGEQDELFGHLEEGVTRLRTLLDGLLAFAQVGEHRPELSEVDLDLVAERTCRVLAAQIDETNAEVTHDPLPTIVGDGSGLGQVLQNLVGNALRFPTPGDPPRVHISAHREPDAWRIEVADQGTGIDEASQERVFTVFERAQDDQHRHGIGIGLAICRKVVERHGGRIWVNSRPGEGSTFAFTLPDRERSDG